MMEKKTNKRPCIVFHCGPVRAAIWSNPTVLGGKMIEKPSIKITKSYVDKDTGEWNSTDNLFVEDLLKVAVVVNEAYRHLRVSMWKDEDTKDPTSNKSVSEPKSISSAKDQE